MMYTFESLDGQFVGPSTQHTAMFPSSTMPIELKMPVPLRPLTIPSVPDFIYEEDSSPISDVSSSPTTPQSKPSSSRKSTPHAHRATRNRGPDHVPRPPNPFILFACHVRSLPNNKGVNNRELSKRAGDLWNELSEDERAFWKAEAQKAKESHAQRYPGYRYQPRRRESTSSEKSVAADGKKNSSKRRPPPLTLQHEAPAAQLLFPHECFSSAASEFEALRSPSYASSSVR
ncbi:HMG-box [Schizopora paradoxa]|uniref:HMG-box n=1 Tax=Schizopora paradoxa TaxID=27342 RepID=A0A0H2S869_9AGAM|nr:HMG-box [Schizopora paradoxa]